MFSLKKILLLTSFLFELIFAEDNENLYDFNYRIQKTEIDSTEIYERMIFQELSVFARALFFARIILRFSPGKPSILFNTR